MDPYSGVTGEPERYELVFALVDRLPRDSDSRYRAERLLHNVEHMARTRDTTLLENLSDQMQALHNMVAVKGSKKRPRKITPVERPESKHAPASLDDIDDSIFG